MPNATEIRLKRAENRLSITFDDGHHFELPAEYLRVESPSAEAQGHGPGERKLIHGRRHVGIISVEAVGNYAIRLIFDDLHDTGIYSWAALYELGVNYAVRWPAYVEALAARGLSRDP